MDELSDFVKAIFIKEIASKYDVDDKLLDFYEKTQKHVSYYANKFGYDINTKGDKELATRRTLRYINNYDTRKLTKLKPEKLFK